MTRVQTEEVAAPLARALDLLRAFALHPEHPDYTAKMLEIKGLLETCERLVRQQAA